MRRRDAIPARNVLSEVGLFITVTSTKWRLTRLGVHLRLWYASRVPGSSLELRIAKLRVPGLRLPESSPRKIDA
jgi:hypothetical protein